MKIHHILLSLFFVLPFYIFAGIAGTYEVHGFDPLTNAPYSGALVIERGHKGVYSAVWTLTTGTDTGTGVKEGHSIAFAFQETVTSGVQLYKIKDNTLEGPWVRLGATQKGTEKAKKICN